MNLARLKSTCCYAVCAIVIMAICSAPGFRSNVQVRRYGAVIGVKMEKLQYYKNLHAKPWATVDGALRRANIRNYSIYLTQFDDGNWYLFSYLEYTGDNFDLDMKKLGENSDVLRWWQETDPCQFGLKNRKEGEWWKSMDEVYHLD